MRKAEKKSDIHLRCMRHDIQNYIKAKVHTKLINFYDDYSHYRVVSSTREHPHRKSINDSVTKRSARRYETK